MLTMTETLDQLNASYSYRAFCGDVPEGDCNNIIKKICEGNIYSNVPAIMCPCMVRRLLAFLKCTKLLLGTSRSN